MSAAASPWKRVEENSAWKPVAEPAPAAPTPDLSRRKANEMQGPAPHPDTYGEKFGGAMTGTLIDPISPVAHAIRHPIDTLMGLPSTIGKALTGDPETLGGLAGGAPYALLPGPHVPEAAGPMIRGAATGAREALTDTTSVHIPGMRALSIPAVAPVGGALVGAEIGSRIAGHVGAAVGAGVGGAAPLVRGAYRGAKQGLQEFRESQIPASSDISPVPLGPPQAPAAVPNMSQAPPAPSRTPIVPPLRPQGVPSAPVPATTANRGPIQPPVRQSAPISSPSPAAQAPVAAQSAPVAQPSAPVPSRWAGMPQESVDAGLAALKARRRTTPDQVSEPTTPNAPSIEAPKEEVPPSFAIPGKDTGPLVRTPEPQQRAALPAQYEEMVAPAADKYAGNARAKDSAMAKYAKANDYTPEVMDKLTDQQFAEFQKLVNPKYKPRVTDKDFQTRRGHFMDALRDLYSKGE